MNSEKIIVQVSRATVAKTDIDLGQFLDSVYEGVLRNFQLFGAEDKWDIWPEEVTLSSVVVYNWETRSYTQASITMEDSGSVSFSKVQEVRRTWTPVEESVSRSEGGASDCPKDDFFPVEMVKRDRWTGIVSR